MPVAGIAKFHIRHFLRVKCENVKYRRKCTATRSSGKKNIFRIINTSELLILTTDYVLLGRTPLRLFFKMSSILIGSITSTYKNLILNLFK